MHSWPLFAGPFFNNGRKWSVRFYVSTQENGRSPTLPIICIRFSRYDRPTNAKLVVQRDPKAQTTSRQLTKKYGKYRGI